MGQYRQITRTVTLDASGGANDTLRCWDPPTGMPLQNLSVTLSSRGQETIAGNLDWEVFYGGKWVGTPFDEDSTHLGGESQGSGNIAGSNEILSIVHTDTDLLPANNPNGPLGGGFPIVVELTNNKAAALTVYVTFTSETIGRNT